MCHHDKHENAKVQRRKGRAKIRIVWDVVGAWRLEIGLESIYPLKELLSVDRFSKDQPPALDYLYWCAGMPLTSIIHNVVDSNLPT